MSGSTPTVERCRWLVSGRVQGVWFRASTRQKALDFGLGGHAINLPDGRVEVLAEGVPSALGQLDDWLRQGPPLAQVQDLSCVERCAIDQAMIDFTTG